MCGGGKDEDIGNPRKIIGCSWRQREMKVYAEVLFRKRWKR
jgi:hypothetical protein